MNTEEQVRKASERYRMWKRGDFPSEYKAPYFTCDGADPAYIDRDRLILADAYIDDLARRESEQAERAKPKWQGEPDSEGEHYVEGIERVCWVFRDDGGSAWAVEYVRTNPATGVSELTWEPLNGRRVCPVGCRPKGGA